LPFKREKRKKKFFKSTSNLLEISFEILKGKEVFNKKKRWLQRAQLSRTLSKKVRPSPLPLTRKKRQKRKRKNDGEQRRLVMFICMETIVYGSKHWVFPLYI
jgi:hypothetical protein